MSEAIHVSRRDYAERVLDSDRLVIVDFWADWCAPCHRVAPLLDELAERFDGRALVAKVNVDEEPGLVQQNEIRTIPTFLFVRDGQVVDRASGVLSRARLDARVEALLGDEEPTAPAAA